MDFSPNNNNTTTIVMFGRTGAGKSSLANKIARENLFPEGNTLWSQTSESISQTISWPLNPSKRITIVDTPGFADNRQGQNLLGDILSFLKKLNGGFNIGIFCISASTRFDAHDLQELDMLGILLGNNVFNHFFLAITQTNTLTAEHREKMFENYPKQLPDILANHGIFSLTAERILFADFDEFEGRFLLPLDKILQEHESNFYQPEIPQQIDLEDGNSIRFFLRDPVMQAWLKREEEIFEKTKRLNEIRQDYNFFEKEKLIQQQKRNQLQFSAEQSSIGYQQRIEELGQQIVELKRVHGEGITGLEYQQVEINLRSGQINNEIFQKENELRDVKLKVAKRQLENAGQAEIDGLNQQINQINNEIEAMRNKGKGELDDFQGKFAGSLGDVNQGEAEIFVKICDLQEEINECYNEDKAISAQYVGEIEEIDAVIQEISGRLEEIAEEHEALQWELLLF